MVNPCLRKFIHVLQMSTGGSMFHLVTGSWGRFQASLELSESREQFYTPGSTKRAPGVLNFPYSITCLGACFLVKKAKWLLVLVSSIEAWFQVMKTIVSKF